CHSANGPQPSATSLPEYWSDIQSFDKLDVLKIQPRINIPFSVPIDTSTVSSSTIFLIGPEGHIVGINQPVWEPLDNTLYLETDEQLAQGTTYLLVVTRALHDAAHRPLDATDFRARLNYGQTKDPAEKADRK